MEMGGREGTASVPDGEMCPGAHSPLLPPSMPPPHPLVKLLMLPGALEQDVYCSLWDFSPPPPSPTSPNP